MSSPRNENQVQNVGDTVKLNCSAGGSLLPKVTWHKDGRRIITTSVSDGSDLIKTELVIHSFRPNDTGIYTCLFHNDRYMAAEANTSLSM